MRFKLLNILGIFLILVVNASANGIPINGLTTGEVSAMYPNLFVPAGITFSIWAVIYLFLIGFCVFPFTINTNKKSLDNIGILFFVTCVLNVLWIYVWHHLYIYISLMVMLLLLASLIAIYLKINRSKPTSKREKWLVYKPFSIYLAWICVATIANTTAVLVHIDFSPPTPAYWAVFAILLTQLLVWFISKKYKDIAFSVVVIWALLGIVIKQSEAGNQIITYTCIACIMFTTIVSFYFRYRKAIN